MILIICLLMFGDVSLVTQTQPWSAFIQPLHCLYRALHGLPTLTTWTRVTVQQVGEELWSTACVRSGLRSLRVCAVMRWEGAGERDALRLGVRGHDGGEDGLRL